MRKTPRQPTKITFRGILFTRIQKQKTLDRKQGIKSGPFYSRPGVDSNDWAYTPDSAYQWSDKDPGVSTMQCIQQSLNPETINPKSVF